MRRSLLGLVAAVPVLGGALLYSASAALANGNPSTDASTNVRASTLNDLFNGASGLDSHGSLEFAAN